MRKIWFFFFLLMVGCTEDNGKQIKFSSVDASLLNDSNIGKNVSVHGFLAKKNGVIFLYSDEKAAAFKGVESNMFRIQIWYPEEKINNDCLNKYVVVHGKKQMYIGSPALDEIIRISNLEDDNLACHPPEKVINYFKELKSTID